jgi:hypothetical protein
MSALEYAVKAETKEGSVLTLRRGFLSEDEASDHPVQMSLWKRVWVEAIGQLAPKVEPKLPPFPWGLDAAVTTDNRGQHHVYLVDATGRKIAAIWGKDHEKMLIANHIVASVNGTS